MTEGRDWTRMQFERCPDCGFDPGGLADDDLGRALTDAAADWGRTLARFDAALLRIRPEPERWSAIEYACHVRDVVTVFGERVSRTLVEDNPALGWWDHEAAAVDDDYRSQDVVLVTEALAAATRGFAATISSVRSDQMTRAAVRRPGEEFTIRGMGRFVLHEVVHHLRDARNGLDELSGPC